MPCSAAEDPGLTAALTSAFEAVQDGLDLLVPDDLKRGDTRIRLGAGFGALPDYKGSDDYRLKALPLIDIRYRRRWRLGYNRLSYGAFMPGNWEVGPFLKYTGGRKESRNPALLGFGNIGATAELGLFARYRTDRMLFNVEARHALGADQGESVRISFGHALYKNGDFALGAVARAKWRSAAAMRTTFGITPAQASRSQTGLAVYTPGAGISGVSVDVIARYRLSERHRLMALASYGRIVGDAARSPLVAAEGSRGQLKIGFGFTIDF